MPYQKHMIAQGWYIGGVCTRERMPQQERTHTLHVTAFEVFSLQGGQCVQEASAWREIQCSEDLQLQNVPHEQLVRARVSNNASDPSPRSYNKPLRLDSFAVLS